MRSRKQDPEYELKDKFFLADLKAEKRKEQQAVKEAEKEPGEQGAEGIPAAVTPESAEKKEPEKKEAEKKEPEKKEQKRTVPNAIHLVRRADYLSKLVE